MRARSPIVFSPSRARRVCTFGPAPQSRDTGSGARNSRSVPGGTITSASGFLRSLATFATYLFEATPTDAVSRSSSAIRCRIRVAISGPVPNSRRLAVTSRKASSSESVSTWSVNERKMSKIRPEISA